MQVIVVIYFTLILLDYGKDLEKVYKNVNKRRLKSRSYYISSLVFFPNEKGI